MQVDEAWVRDEFSEKMFSILSICALRITEYKLRGTLKCGLENTKLFECVTLDLESAAFLAVMLWQGI